MTNFEFFNSRLSGRNQERRRLGNNTWLVRRGKDIAVKLYETDVLTFRPDGSIVLNSGGRKTSTTKDRINRYLPNPFWVEQRDMVWFLVTREWSVDTHTWVMLLCVPFKDGMVIHASGKVTGAEKETAEKDKKLKKRISTCS